MEETAGSLIRQLEIHIPIDPQPSDIKETCVKIINNLQEASRNLNSSEKDLAIAETNLRFERLKHMAQILDEYRENGKRLPARGTLEDLVELNVEELTLSRDQAKVIRQAWKNTYQTLIEIRKACETAERVLVAEMYLTRTGNMSGGALG